VLNLNEKLIRILIKETLKEYYAQGRTILPPRPSSVPPPSSNKQNQKTEDQVLKDFENMLDNWLKLNNNKNLQSSQIWTSFINDTEHLENRQFINNNLETLNKRRSDIRDLISQKTRKLHEKNNKYFIRRGRS